MHRYQQRLNSMSHDRKVILLAYTACPLFPPPDMRSVSDDSIANDTRLWSDAWAYCIMPPAINNSLHA
jgi:hypothetical protein